MIFKICKKFFEIDLGSAILFCYFTSAPHVAVQKRMELLEVSS